MEVVDALRQSLSEQVSCGYNQCVVAYSGGVDSHVLLHAAHNIINHFPQWQLTAVHVNHGINANAEQWQQHCQQVCAELDVPLQIARLNICKAPRQSLEAVAREQRYQALEKLAGGNNLVLLGQHQDDQLETLLLQLKRGAGPRGLSGMPAVSDSANGLRYLRPLLDISRDAIVEYATTHKLQWQEDDSNQDTAYDRNFLRHDVVPLLASRWPAIGQTAARSATLCAEQQALLDEVTSQRLEPLLREHQQLHVSGLLAYSPPWRRQLLRSWLAQAEARLPAKAVLQQIEQMLEAREDAKPQVCWPDWQVRRYQDYLYLLPGAEATPAGQSSSLQLGNNAISHQQKQLVVSAMPVNDAVVINQPADLKQLTLEYGGLNRRFKPQGSPHSKPLKQWLKAWQIPPWQRQLLPLVCCQGQVLAMVSKGELIVAEQDTETPQKLWLSIVDSH